MRASYASEHLGGQESPVAAYKDSSGGEDVVIANRGEPVVRLVPARDPAAAKVNRGSARAILNWLGSHPLPAYARRSAEEIDAAIAAERSAWD